MLSRWVRGVGWLAVVAGLGCEPGVGPFPEGQRIISLSPSISRVLLALGVGDEIVAVDRFSRDLPGLEAVPSLGGLYSPDLERTVELRPTLVLAVSSAQQAGFFDRLRARGVQVEEIEVYTLEEVLESFVRIGQHVGRRPEAEALVRRVRGELEQVAASVKGLPRRTVALILERDPLYVAGRGAFIHTLIETAGGENVFSDLAAPYPRVSLEVLAEREPEIILDTFLDPARGAEAEEGVRRYWRRFGWVQRAEPFPPSAAVLPAPDLSEGARLLRARIHPELESP
ncbi:MAG: hypothetical protein E2O71_00730 [Deltaproteobacteria bacterium]|nr:MAG: hypothetical protein E2O71_00730 [Deltaproteobacteria bacterium]